MLKRMNILAALPKKLNKASIPRFPSLVLGWFPSLVLGRSPSGVEGLFLLLFLLLFLSSSSQSITHQVGPYYVIQDSTAALRRDCLFCDPATMPDRMILDSTHRMIARKVSHPFGYTYYEWRDPNYEKSMEQITYRPFLMAYTQYYQQGKSLDTPAHNTHLNTYISYYRNGYQKAQPYAGTWTVRFVHIKLPSAVNDSLIQLYPYLKPYTKNGAEFWRVLNLQENGVIQSNGLILYAYDHSKQSMGIKPLQKKYKVGQWRYYNAVGKLQKIENNTMAIPIP
jgi:hypothetical protein